MAYKIHTKEIICSIIIIFIGSLTKLSNSTAVNALSDSIQTSERNDPAKYYRKQPKIDDSIDDAKHLDIFDDNDSDDDFVSIEVDDQLTLKEQLRMLTKQMNKRFQHELKTTIRKAAQELLKTDLQSQIEQLRYLPINFFCFICIFIKLILWIVDFSTELIVQFIAHVK